MAQQAGQAQQQQAAQQQAAAPQAPAGPVATDKLQGNIPDILTGDRRKSQLFMRQFNLLWGLNKTHEIMTIPYFRAIYALSLMQGPNINDWVNNQVLKLRDSVGTHYL